MVEWPHRVSGDTKGTIQKQPPFEVSAMTAASIYPVRPEVAANTLTDEATYKAMYQQSVINPDGF